jgi:hypothetical protein
MNTQPALPSLNIALVDRSRRSIGLMGENHAARLLEQSGYLVSFTQYAEKRGDLRAIDCKTGQIYKVEVKTARRSIDRKWRFTLYMPGLTDHRHSDVVILLAILECGSIIPFVVPIHILKDQRQAVITSHPETYAGKLAEFRTTTGVIKL